MKSRWGNSDNKDITKDNNVINAITNISDNVNVNDNVNDTDIKKNTATYVASVSKKLTRPTLEQVKKYCDGRQN
jgi:hypothetical protein